MTESERYFFNFRKQIIGINTEYNTAYGTKKIIYGDWIASGRLYSEIEQKITNTFGEFIGNTHTEASETGTRMTKAYHYAHNYIKSHVNAASADVILTAGFGMTAVVNKLQRILGLKYCGSSSETPCQKEIEKPVVFLTHMEHHSNHTSWLETKADVIVIPPDENLLINLNNLRAELEKYKSRKFKIGAFTACSNVTGIMTPYHQMAKIMHEFEGLCFVDFAASAPYVDINMHPTDPMEKLDAIYFSPHKFLGGPGSSGVLIFDSKMYHSRTPDDSGGGTVDWTNPWGEYKYVDDIETREDGGTPGFLQSIRTALAIELKSQMGTSEMMQREHELLEIAFAELPQIPHIHILASNEQKRLGVISFYFDHIHYNLVVKLLSDRYGIQTRSGCACAGTYGHYLLQVSHEQSQKITEKINHGDLSEKPGWVRLSLHPTMSNEELHTIIVALKEISENINEFKLDYNYIPAKNEFYHNTFKPDYKIAELFKFTSSGY